MAALLPTERDHDKPKDRAKRSLIGFKKEKRKALHPGQKNPEHQHRLGRAGWVTALLERPQVLGQKPAGTGVNISLQRRQAAERGPQVRDTVPSLPATGKATLHAPGAEVRTLTHFKEDAEEPRRVQPWATKVVRASRASPKWRG